MVKGTHRCSVEDGGAVGAETSGRATAPRRQPLRGPTRWCQSPTPHYRSPSPRARQSPSAIARFLSKKGENVRREAAGLPRARRVPNATSRCNRPGNVVLTLAELRHITKNFSDDQLVGEGTFGKVYKGVLTNGDVIAVKRFASTITGLQDGQYENEAEHLMWLEHPNIVQLVGYCSETQTKLVRLNGKFVRAEQSERLLCLEYMPKGSLRGHLSDESSGLDWKTRYNIIKGICYGLHYLHEERQATPIIHMDLKPANILLDDNMVPKIADFGLSRLFGEEQTRTCTTSCKGTPGYMAPEYLEKGVITKKFDIFSLGVIIIEIITGLKGYPTEETETTSQQYIDMVLNNWRHRSKDIDYQQINKCIQIGLLCVKFDGAKRPTIDQIIKMLERSDEAYKNEREDAYALCRVFKKTQPGPKIIEHYGAVHHPIEQPQWMGSSVDRSPMLDMSSDVRGDDFESSSFLFPTEAPMDSMHGGFGMQMSAPHEDGKWMQFLSEDAFNATNPFFMNPASHASHPRWMLHWSVQGFSTGSHYLPWRWRTSHRTSASTQRRVYSAATPTRLTSFKSSSLWHWPPRS